ncbi:MAG: site-specific integrase, partial [Rhodospirillales bacterium]|nr:site-specific integrase [Rhodospirillales bacterium]
DLGEAQARLQDFLAAQHLDAAASAGPRHPNQMTVAEVLDLYGKHHAPTTSSPQRIGYAIEALARWWGDALVSAVSKATCQRYVTERRKALAEKRAQQAQARAEAAERAAAAKPGKPGPKPKARPVKQMVQVEPTTGTARRELGALKAALNWCREEGYLTEVPVVWLPEKPKSRQRWLTRKEAAALLRAARAEEKSRLHLPLFILLGLYTGARRDAILSLQWHPNTAGGWVDLERGLIDFQGGRATTNKRRSHIPIPARLLTFLRHARARTRQYVIEFEGKPVANVRRSFSRSCADAGLKNVTPHTLRHTAVTWLVQSGVSLWEVAQWVGMSVDMIEQVYGHHAPDKFKRVQQVISRGGR